MRFGPASAAVALTVCLGVSGATGVANAAAGPTTSSAPVTATRPAGAAGGMYGELAGSPTRTVPQLRIQPNRRASESATGGGQTGDYNDGETVCGVYANSAGMGSYCASGNEHIPSLIERFPGMHFDNCRYEDPPPGVEVPPNPSPDEKKWQLRTCLTAINWLTWDGGDDRRIIMDLVLVDSDFDNTYDETPLSRFLWHSKQTMYPIPMLKVEPKTYPVVGQRAYFTFNWLDAETRKPVRDPNGPYAHDQDGGPYVEHHNRGITMRARAGDLWIDPKIEGDEPFECAVADLGYDKHAKQQHSDCYHVFDRSSSVAWKYSTAKHYLDGDRDVFRMKIDVRWDVDYTNPGGGMRPLGDGYHMIVYQDLPVLDTEAVNIPPPEGSIG